MELTPEPAPVFGAWPAEAITRCGGEPHRHPRDEGWRYGSFRTNDDGDRRTVTLVHESGFETTVELPDFVSQGEEVGDVARIVIAAWERQEAMKGVGG